MNTYTILNDKLNELYTYIKQIAPKYYKNSKMTSEYCKLKDKILEIEELIPKIYL